MRGVAAFLSCLTIASLCGGAHGEILKFTESAAPQDQRQGTGAAYSRLTVEVEGVLNPRDLEQPDLYTSLAGADGRISFKFPAVLLRPRETGQHRSTLLLDLQPEPHTGDLELLPVARQRNMIVLFAPSLETLAKPIRAAALRDLVSYLRQAAKVAHVFGRGADADAELLEAVARRPKEPRSFDGLLLQDAPFRSEEAANENEPLVIETISSSAYWRGALKAADAKTWSGRRPRFFLAGAAARKTVTPTDCAAPINLRSIEPATRALLAALDDWALRGVAPPASRVPRIEDRTLVNARDLHWQRLPGLAAPLAGDRLVPAIDTDGNEIGGLRLPDQAVPIGTFTGWNAGKDKMESPCAGAGAFLPFAKSKIDREKANDPRLSLQERYGLRDFYVATVRVVADKLVKERLLLKQDADDYVAAAKKAPF